MQIFQLIIIVVATLVLTHSIKRITKISRPENSLVKLSDYAFPSGHTSMSFALATFYTFFILDLPIDFISKILLVGVLFAGVVSIVYWRLQIRVHTWFQILAGAILGIFISVLVMNI